MKSIVFNPIANVISIFCNRKLRKKTDSFTNEIKNDSGNEIKKDLQKRELNLDNREAYYNRFISSRRPNDFLDFSGGMLGI